MGENLYGPRTILTENDILFLAGAFQIGPVSLSKDLGGAYNLNLLLTTEKGNVVLRVHRPWVTQLRLEQLHEMKSMLARAGFPVPLPLATTNGETTLHYKDRLVELEPFIAHDGEADTWGRNFVAFSLLGKLHNFLAAQPDSVSLIEPVVSNYGTPDMLLTWTRQAAEKVAQSAQSSPSHETQSALSLYAEAIQLLSSLQARWQAAKAYLPRQLTHGDYGGGNLLFRQERVVAILDFDFLRVRERVFEVAYTLYWWLYRQGNGQIAKVSEWPRVKELLAAYNEAAQQPLTQAEIQVLPLEMACVPLYWIAETNLFPHPEQEAIKHAAKVANASWLFAHSSQLADLFMET